MWEVKGRWDGGWVWEEGRGEWGVRGRWEERWVGWAGVSTQCNNNSSSRKLSVGVGQVLWGAGSCAATLSKTQSDCWEVHEERQGQVGWRCWGEAGLPGLQQKLCEEERVGKWWVRVGGGQFQVQQ